MLFMVATIYFNLRAIKELSSLDDYRENKMGEITENRAQMMEEQAKKLAEKKKLEKEIKLEQAKVDSRMRELEGGKKKSKGQKFDNPMDDASE